MTARRGNPWADVARTSLLLNIGAKSAGKQVNTIVRLLVNAYRRMYLDHYSNSTRIHTMSSCNGCLSSPRRDWTNRSIVNVKLCLRWSERDWLDNIERQQSKREWQPLPLPFVNGHSDSAETEPGSEYQINQHSCDIHQRVDDHEIRQKRGTELEYQPGKEGERQEHAEPPEQVTTV